MINTLSIKNYKSVVDLDLDLSHFNLFIGENGSGKSNILEALCLAGAATVNKLDNELLSARGVKLTVPELMRPVFSSEPASVTEQAIHLSLNMGGATTSYLIQHSGAAYDTWKLQTEGQASLSQYTELMQQLKTPNLAQNKKMQLLLDAEQFLRNGLPWAGGQAETLLPISPFNDVSQFRIYSPEISSLRALHKEEPFEPLGLHGEGILRLLKNIQQDTDRYQELCKSLMVFDGFERLEPLEEDNSLSDQFFIQDHYLNRALDQSSMSDGFLFVLFCLSLVIAKETPMIFAIDHIDIGLNPKLCTKLIGEISRLAQKYNKQVFATTHNPGALDGIDLADEGERLYVISRSRKGYTRAQRITLDQKPKMASGESLKLSEAFLRGYLGGLPKGF